MRIGILGSGDVGQALGHGFVDTGHEVVIGSRTPDSEKLKTWLTKHPQGTSVGTFEAAAKFGEILVLATHWEGGATKNAIELAHPENFSGKIVIDVTNPLDFSGGIPPKLVLGHTNSAGEEVQRWLPAAKVVKAWNIIGNNYMYKPKFTEGQPDMFICGNDQDAKRKVSEILGEFGWPGAIDIGGIEGARYLEALAMLWIIYGFRTNTWQHAFKLLKS